MLFRRFGISSRAQRITLSVIALLLALVIAFLQDDQGAAREATAPAMRDSGAATAASPTEAAGRQIAPQPQQTQVRAQQTERERAVATAVRWLKGQEGGKHRGHAIARHVGKSDAQLRARLERDGKSVVSGFYDIEAAAVAIVRTIRYSPNDRRVQRWLKDDESRRRLALRRTFDRPVGRIVYRDGGARDGATTVAVLTKWRESGRIGYRLLTAYVEP